MMWHTRTIYNDIVNKKELPDPQFTKEYLPAWEKLDKIADNMFVRLLFAVGYTLFYIYFAPNLWWFLLLPIHFLMGPVQGAIVNWCGHKYGYSNYNNGDHSKNSEPFGILLLGELFQDNHHQFGTSPNFAKKWFEVDPAYQVMIVLDAFKIIRLKRVTITKKEINN